MAHRPELHVTPECGILDAPAGVLYDGESWHMFLQFRPHPEDGARWAHQVSHENPFSWEICDDVLAPTDAEIKVRAGAVVAHGDDTDLYYTSVSDSGDCIKVASIHDLDATYEQVSDEPSHIDTNVVGHHVVVENQAGLINFRSPCVVPDWKSLDDRAEGHKGWLMLAVAGSMDTPQLQVLSSEDGSKWNYVGPLELRGDTGLGSERIVSPRIIRLRDHVDENIYDILVLTVETHGIDRSGYLVGTLKENVFNVHQPFERIDYGHDFTRPRNTNFAKGAVEESQRYSHAYLFGLMNGIGRLDNPLEHHSFTTEDWANCLSLPRRTTLQNGKIYQTPVQGLPSAIEHADHAAMWSGLLDVAVGQEVVVHLHDSIGQVAATIAHRGDYLELDRSMNPQHQGDDIAVAPLTEGDSDTLTIIVDGSTVEVFADGGQVAMASRVYFNGSCEEFEVRCSDKAKVEQYSELFSHDARKAHFSADEEVEGPVR